MDLVTHIIVGASIGEAALGKKLGRMALITGAVTSLFPDLDILVAPFFNPITGLEIHRGISHSLFFLILISPLLGWMFKKGVHYGSWYDWTKLFTMVLVSHITLDVLTNYGTQIFQPFSHYQVSLGSISVVDPVFTLPVLVGLLTSLWLTTSLSKRKFYSRLGLMIGGIYLLFTIGNKAHIRKIIESNLRDQGILYEKLAIVPSSSANLLWHGVAQNENGWYIGDYSILDKSKHIDFRFFKGENTLLSQLGNISSIDQLKWYANGFYLVRQVDGVVRMYHLKCHLTKGYDDNNMNPSASYFELTTDEFGSLDVKLKMMDTQKKGKSLYASKWKRMLGK